MSEKVLGFKEKDTWHIFANRLLKEFIVPVNKLVPVNLKSESVTLEWLEKEFDKCVELTDFELGKEFEDESPPLEVWSGKLKGYLFSAAKNSGG